MVPCLRGCTSELQTLGASSEAGPSNCNHNQVLLGLAKHPFRSLQNLFLDCISRQATFPLRPPQLSFYHLMTPRAPVRVACLHS